MRKLMWFTVGFGAACAIGAYFYTSLILIGSIAGLIVSLVLWMTMRWCRTLRIGVAIFLGISVGFGWFACYDRGYLWSARNADGETCSTIITVSDYSFQTSYGCGYDGELTMDGKSYRVRVYLDAFEELEPGNAVTGDFFFRLTTNDAAEEPTYHQGKGIFLIAYQDGDYEIMPRSRLRWQDYPAVWRQRLIEIIDGALPSDTAGFAKALLLGDRSGIDYEINTAFKVSGISHVIAVSGLHVSILFGLVYSLAGRRRFLTALIGIPAIVIFAAIAGFSPSVVRAGIMQILVMIALLFDKDYDPLTALAFAALVMLIGNPLVITSVSFQLSVSCMVGIFLFSERIRQWLSDKQRMGRRKGKWVRWFCSSVSISLSAMVFTTPLVAVYFGTVSLIGVFTNLLTLWAITYIFYGVMLVCAIGCVHLGVASALGWLVSWGIRYVLAVAKLFSRVPMAAVYTKSIYIVIWLVFCYCLFGLYLILQKKTPIIFSAAGVLGLCLAIALSWSEPLLDECRVTVLDVGQGQSILLQSEGKNYLVDCGGSYEEDTADITAETLLSQGISRLDGIILTHYDKDHVGGTEYLLTRIRTDALYLPFAQDEDGVGKALADRCPEAVVSVGDDIVLTFGMTKITIFAPVSYESGNESSMCVLFQTENCAILITGDRGIRTERMLIERYEIPKLDVLVAGHHGAETSTCEELLAATRPEYVIISVGKDNPYGHPSPEVITRLKKYRCKILRTDLYGTILYRR